MRAMRVWIVTPKGQRTAFVRTQCNNILHGNYFLPSSVEIFLLIQEIGYRNINAVVEKCQIGKKSLLKRGEYGAEQECKVGRRREIPIKKPAEQRFERGSMLISKCSLYREQPLRLWITVKTSRTSVRHIEASQNSLKGRLSVSEFCISKYCGRMHAKVIEGHALNTASDFPPREESTARRFRSFVSSGDGALDARGNVTLVDPELSCIKQLQEGHQRRNVQTVRADSRPAKKRAASAILPGMYSLEQQPMNKLLESRVYTGLWSLAHSLQRRSTSQTDELSYRRRRTTLNIANARLVQNIRKPLRSSANEVSERRLQLIHRLPRPLALSGQHFSSQETTLADLLHSIFTGSTPTQLHEGRPCLDNHLPKYRLSVPVQYRLFTVKACGSVRECVCGGGGGGGEVTRRQLQLQLGKKVHGKRAGKVAVQRRKPRRRALSTIPSRALAAGRYYNNTRHIPPAPRSPPGRLFVGESDHIQRYGGNTASIARRGDKALGVRGSVARIAPSILDLGRGVPKAGGPVGSVISSEAAVDQWVERSQVGPEWSTGYKYIDWSHRGPVGSVISSGAAVDQWVERSQPLNRIGRCCWSAGFLGDLSFTPHYHTGAAPYSPRSPASALKTLLLRAAQISSLTHSPLSVLET
ncbi:hypothetical protein PR048_000366 [Dryococelus australis]|uniref:Ribosomal protein S3 n=1 Tax=Dryococelus australis TaxID=614101 RepID=A0ABQ9IEY5_9NEOP|nr:hypothetical protein PR048_000366 [Dryococelus australis]